MAFTMPLEMGNPNMAAIAHRQRWQDIAFHRITQGFSLLVLVVASFSVVGALAMLIVDKRRDIVTLRALGADTSLVRAIFRSEGLLICGLGAACGALLGVGLSLLQQHFGLIEIPAETLLAKSYPVEFRPGDLLAVLVAFGLVAYVISNITVRSMVKHNA